MKTSKWLATGLVAGAVLLVAAPVTHASSSFHFSISLPWYCAPPPPPPPAPRPCRVWVPGHYETRTEKYWVPGRTETVWVPTEYKEVWRGHHKLKIVCRPGHYETIQHTGRYECREVRVWVPGHYEIAAAD